MTDGGDDDDERMNDMTHRQIYWKDTII